MGELIGGDAEEEVEKVGGKMEMKMKRRKEKKRELGVRKEEEAGEGEEGSSEDIAQDTLGGEDQEDLAKRRVEKWRVMMEEEEGDVDAAVEVSEVAGDSVAVEDSVEAMTEEKAALNSAICFAITSFQTTSST